jgi:hypothetical protein
VNYQIAGAVYEVRTYGSVRGMGREPHPTRFAPLLAPRRAPGRAPILAPRRAPGRAPILAQRRAPRHAPGRAPILAPGHAPKLAPILAPRHAPILAPILAPGRAPIPSPGLSLSQSFFRHLVSLLNSICHSDASLQIASDL